MLHRPLPLLAGAVLLSSILDADSAATDFATLPMLQGILPGKTDYYEIDQKVGLAPPYLVFQVKTTHAT